VNKAPCTCSGCPAVPWRILGHFWQEEAFNSGEPYEPCMVRGGDLEEDVWCCRCSEPATQEDLLCDTCRQKGGISYLDQDRLREFLSRSGPLGQVNRMPTLEVHIP
jgi:hypothetical protein